jgi:hypothetical protein
VDDIIAEADSDSGTWTLSTTIKVRNSVATFNQSDITYFVGALMDVVLREGTKVNTIYTMAQLSTFLVKLAIPILHDAFKPYEEKILTACVQLEGNDDLGKATATLFHSVFTESAHFRPSSRGSFTPKFTSSKHPSRGVCSRTPEPRLHGPPRPGIKAPLGSDRDE